MIWTIPNRCSCTSTTATPRGPTHAATSTYSPRRTTMNSTGPFLAFICQRDVSPSSKSSAISSRNTASNPAVTTGVRFCGGMRSGSERFSGKKPGRTVGHLHHLGLADDGIGWGAALGREFLVRQSTAGQVGRTRRPSSASGPFSMRLSMELGFGRYIAIASYEPISRSTGRTIRSTTAWRIAWPYPLSFLAPLSLLAPPVIPRAPEESRLPPPQPALRPTPLPLVIPRPLCHSEGPEESRLLFLPASPDRRPRNQPPAHRHSRPHQSQPQRAPTSLLTTAGQNDRLRPRVGHRGPPSLPASG